VRETVDEIILFYHSVVRHNIRLLILMKITYLLT